ncbi:MAG: hypothetical protein WKF53_17340 [Rubrobacter sp.]
MAARITERRAANAARQRLYHRERLAWMEDRMGENTALLEAYLALAGEKAKRVCENSTEGHSVGDGGPDR